MYKGSNKVVVVVVASKLEKHKEIYEPITFEEIVIVMITADISW